MLVTEKGPSRGLSSGTHNGNAVVVNVGSVVELLFDLSVILFRRPGGRKHILAGRTIIDSSRQQRAIGLQQGRLDSLDAGRVQTRLVDALGNHGA